MGDNLSLKELMELAKMKETRPREYQKTLEGIKSNKWKNYCSRDCFHGRFKNVRN